nr:retrovirus-related Pol polyprotein from transposon TNT 1-94 [Tanacetum cinerariifolium]
MLAEESRSKMIEKQNDPQMIEKKVITKPINYDILNKLSTDFETRFVSQTESSAKQAFWSQYSVQTDEPNLSGTTIVEVPKELPKESMVNSCLKKLKFHLTSFDMVVKERTTATAITEGTWGFEHTKACFRDDIIPFIKSLKELLNSFDQCLIDEVTKVQNVFTQMKLAVEQHCEEKTKRDTWSSQESAPTFAELFEINNLKAQAQAKDTVILKLKEKLNTLNGDVNDRNVKRDVEEIKTLNIELDHKEKVLVITALKVQLDKLKVKAVLTEAVSLNPIDPELLKIDVAQLVPKLRKNRTAHTDYIRHTQEEAATLREIVESERLISLLNTSLVYAWTKLVAVTPKNKNNQIRYTMHVTKSERTTVTTPPSTNLASNTPVFSSTGVNLVSSASGSLSQDNTKHNRIQRTQKKAKKNKIEDHLRTVKSSLNKESVVDSKATSSVINYVTNVNFDLKCASYNGCLLSDNHAVCVVEYINSVNTSKKSKSVNTPVKRKVWKTTRKVFKSVGHIWKPTGRIFTLVGNVCPLTRIATPTIVPPRERIPIVNSTDKPVVTLKFLGTVKFGNDHVAKIMGYGDYHIRNVTISWVYYVEGLGHNLFFVGQFCDSDLEVAFRQHTCFIRNLDVVDLLTGVKPSTSASGSQPSGNTKKDKNQRPPHNTQKNKVEAHPRTAKSSLKNKNYNGTEFINHTLRDYYEEVGISHETSVARSPQQNGVVERRNRTLIEAACTMLIYAQAPFFLWAEAMATVCFTQNRSIIRLRHGKTSYEFLHNRIPDLSFFYVFGALCYPTNDSKNLGKLQPKADIGIFIGYALTKKAFRIYNRRTRRIVETIHVDFDELTAMAFEHLSSGPALNEMTPRTTSSGLVPTSSPSTSYVPPSRNDWDLLFQPMFDELLNPPPSVVNQTPKAISPIAEVIPPGYVNSTGLPFSTTVEQDAPSTSNSPTPTETQSSVIPQDVRDDNLDIGNDPLFGVPIPEVTSAQSTT